MSTTRSTELLAAIRTFLRGELLPGLEGVQAYNTRIANNALGIVARELELGPALAELDDDMAQHLGLDRSQPAGVQIALALRQGTLPVNAELINYLRARTRLALAIDNPKYSGLQQARERWPD